MQMLYRALMFQFFMIINLNWSYNLLFIADTGMLFLILSLLEVALPPEWAKIYQTLLLQ